MSISNRKVALLLEHHYQQNLDELRTLLRGQGLELELVSHLWGLDALTFNDLEFASKEVVSTEIEAVNARDYAAILVPDGYAADRLRYQNRFTAKNDAPATRFVRAALTEGVTVGICGFGIWLLTVAPDLLKGRTITTRPEAVADARNAGATIVDGLPPVYADGNLMTCRDSSHMSAFVPLIARRTSR